MATGQVSVLIHGGVARPAQIAPFATIFIPAVSTPARPTSIISLSSVYRPGVTTPMHPTYIPASVSMTSPAVTGGSGAFDDPLHGVISRNSYTTFTGTWSTQWAAAAAGTVVNVDWKNLQPTAAFQSIALSAGVATINAELAYYAPGGPMDGKKLRIRMLAGIRGPKWLCDLLGSVVICDTSVAPLTIGVYWDSTISYTNPNQVVSELDGNYYRAIGGPFTTSTDPSLDATHWAKRTLTNPQAGNVPIWWSTTTDTNSKTYVDYYTDVMTQLANMYDSNPLVADICFVAGTTVFDETLGKQLYKSTGQINPASINQTHMAAARGLGGSGDYYTSTKDFAAYQACLSAMTVWKQSRIYIAHLIYDYVSSTTTTNSSAITLTGTGKTIPVASTAAPSGEVSSRDFPSAGFLTINGSLVAYTSTDATHFYGCTGTAVIAAYPGTTTQVVAGSQDFTGTQEMILAAANTLGEQVVLGNNGFKDERAVGGGTQSQLIWTELALYDGCISLQSTQYGNIGNGGLYLPDDVAAAAAIGAQCFELPEGYQAQNPSGFTTAIAALVANWTSYHPRIIP